MAGMAADRGATVRRAQGTYRAARYAPAWLRPPPDRTRLARPSPARRSNRENRRRRARPRAGRRRLGRLLQDGRRAGRRRAGRRRAGRSHATRPRAGWPCASRLLGAGRWTGRRGGDRRRPGVAGWVGTGWVVERSGDWWAWATSASFWTTTVGPYRCETSAADPIASTCTVRPTGRPACRLCVCLATGLGSPASLWSSNEPG